MWHELNSILQRFHDRYTLRESTTVQGRVKPLAETLIQLFDDMKVDGESAVKFTAEDRVLTFLTAAVMQARQIEQTQWLADQLETEARQAQETASQKKEQAARYRKLVERERLTVTTDSTTEKQENI